MFDVDSFYNEVRGSVQEENCITQIRFKTICQVDARNGTILRLVSCPNMGGLIEIVGIDGGYILHGETELFCYDKQLNRVWSFCGRDIFATLDGSSAFWIEADIIHCRDWLGWHYVLDYDGNLVAEFLETSPGS